MWAKASPGNAFQGRKSAVLTTHKIRTETLGGIWSPDSVSGNESLWYQGSYSDEAPETQTTWLT